MTSQCPCKFVLLLSFKFSKSAKIFHTLIKQTVVSKNKPLSAFDDTKKHSVLVVHLLLGN